MNWNEYRTEQNSARFDPNFKQRVLDKAAAQQDLPREPKSEKQAARFARRGLIAAIAALVITVTAFAAAMTNWDIVRHHLGIGKNDTIDGYTEFSDPAQNRLSLVSTLRSSDTLTIYVEASPIQIDRRFETLSGKNPDKTVQGRVDHAVAFDTSIIRYDKDAQTALVGITVERFDTDLDKLRELDVTLELLNWSVVEAVYGPVTVPVTQAKTLNAFFDIPFSSSLGEGHFTQAVVGAKTIELYYSFAEYGSWEKAIFWEDAPAPDDPEASDWYARYDEVTEEFLTAWMDASCALAADTRLEFADGTSLLATDEDSDALGGRWLSYPDSLSMDHLSSLGCIYRFGLAQDLTQITGITIAGVTYPLVPTE